MDLTPKKTTMAPRTREGNAEPNPFLTNGWLQTSFESGEAYEVRVPGTWSREQRKNNKGEPYTYEDGSPVLDWRLGGDAAKVKTWLNDAARLLGIGVSIQYVPANGEEERPKGLAADKIVVKFLGKQRKASKAKKNEPSES